MDQGTQLLVLPQSGEEAIAQAGQLLSSAGLRVMRSFDLRSARTLHGDYPCPHHETERCDCQFMVLLVYGPASPPATLLLHSYDGQTWISLVNAPEQRPGPDLEDAIAQALAAEPLA